jgi:regulator of nonsense transcripts 1
MKAITLRVPALDDQSWKFDVPQELLSVPLTLNRIDGPVISFSIEAITLRIERFPSNRILNSDDPTKFLLMSFNRTFRFPDQPPKMTVEYITRMMKTGFFLNGIQYRFYHHSNSQLVSLYITAQIVVLSFYQERTILLSKSG